MKLVNSAAMAKNYLSAAVKLVVLIFGLVFGGNISNDTSRASIEG
jgi:hypothetical protein